MLIYFQRSVFYEKIYRHSPPVLHPVEAHPTFIAKLARFITLLEFFFLLLFKKNKKGSFVVVMEPMP